MDIVCVLAVFCDFFLTVLKREYSTPHYTPHEGLFVSPKYNNGTHIKGPIGTLDMRPACKRPWTWIGRHRSCFGCGIGGRGGRGKRKGGGGQGDGGGLRPEFSGSGSRFQDSCAEMFGACVVCFCVWH